MKITKTELRNIVMEEYEAVQEEKLQQIDEALPAWVLPSALKLLGSKAGRALMSKAVSMIIDLASMASSGDTTKLDRLMQIFKVPETSADRVGGMDTTQEEVHNMLELLGMAVKPLEMLKSFLEGVSDEDVATATSVAGDAGIPIPKV